MFKLALDGRFDNGDYNLLEIAGSFGTLSIWFGFSFSPLFTFYNDNYLNLLVLIKAANAAFVYCAKSNGLLIIGDEIV